MCLMPLFIPVWGAYFWGKKTPNKQANENFISLKTCFIYWWIINETCQALMEFFFSFQSALNKISRFILENVFETKVSGRLAAYLCRSCARVSVFYNISILVYRFVS